MERFTCRTCLSIVNKNSVHNVINNYSCFSNKTLKDVLLNFIPSMETTLSENDQICSLCFNTLQNFTQFIDKCLEIEENLTRQQAKVQYINNKDVAGNFQSIENIQIVLNEDSKPFYQKSNVDVNIRINNETITHDHSYIKPINEANESTNEHENGNLEEISTLQFIPAVTEQLLASNVGKSKNHQESILENSTITLLSTEDDPSKLEFAHIKDESMDSLDFEAAGYYISEEKHTNIYVCDLCGSVFLTQKLLRQHFGTHGVFRIMCDKCPKVFNNQSALKAHYKLKHTESEPYKCNICEQQFARADYLRNHLKRHDNSKKDNVKCRVPGKFLRFKNTEEPLPCKICGKFYNGIQKLKVHLQTHLVVNRFACEYCDLTYKRWPSLKRHEKTHLEADSLFYRCNVCWKRFSQKEELDLHMNQHGNPRYRCQVCNEQFHRKYLFDNHYLLTHATPEDIENSKKEVIYDTLLELSNQNILVTE